MFKKIKEKIQQTVTLWMFRKIRGTYSHAFKQANDVFATLEEEKKTKYLLDVKRWVSSDAFQHEVQAFIRKFMGRLSFNSVTETESAAIRETLLFIKEWEVRLMTLAGAYDALESQKSTVEVNKIINRI